MMSKPERRRMPSEMCHVMTSAELYYGEHQKKTLGRCEILTDLVLSVQQRFKNLVLSVQQLMVLEAYPNKDRQREELRYRSNRLEKQPKVPMKSLQIVCRKKAENGDVHIIRQNRKWSRQSC